MTLEELIKSAPIPDQDPCVESYIKICCREGTPIICYEHEQTAAKMGSSGCGGGKCSWLKDAIANGWTAEDCIKLAKMMK